MGFICSTIFLLRFPTRCSKIFPTVLWIFINCYLYMVEKSEVLLKLFYGILNLFQMYHQNTVKIQSIKLKKVRKHEIASPWISNEIKTINLFNHFCHDLADLSCKLHLINQQENLYCFMIKIYEDSVLFAYYNNFTFYKHH